MAEKFRRLPGRGVQLYGVKRLYTGSDHILQITFAAGSEEYKRFYFSDVQALIIRRTSGYIWWSIAWGSVAALWFMWALSILNHPSREFMEIPLMVIGGFFAFLLAVHLALGPTCSVMLQTAVHRERLTSLTRVRGARKMLARVSPLLAKAQALSEAVGTGPVQPLPPAANPVSSPQYSEEP